MVDGHAKRMHAQLTVPPVRDRRHGRTVASYVDARGAVLAAAALRRRGFEPEAVTVQPGQMALDAMVLQPRHRRPDWIAPTVAGAVAFSALLVLGDGRLGALPVAVALSLGAAGLARLAVLAHRGWLRRRHDQAARRVVAHRFDVVVSDRDDEAEHLLASWWDPDAVPVPTERAPVP